VHASLIFVQQGHRGEQSTSSTIKLQITSKGTEWKRKIQAILSLWLHKIDTDQHLFYVGKESPKSILLCYKWICQDASNWRTVSFSGQAQKGRTVDQTLWFATTKKEDHFPVGSPGLDLDCEDDKPTDKARKDTGEGRYIAYLYPENRTRSQILEQHLFSIFMRSVVGSLQVRGQTTLSIRNDEPLVVNSQLAKIAQEFVKHELGSAEEAYICIIPRLAAAKGKLPVRLASKKENVTEIKVGLKELLQRHLDNGPFLLGLLDLAKNLQNKEESAEKPSLLDYILRWEEENKSDSETDSETGKTALQWAAAEGLEDIVRLVLEIKNEISVQKQSRGSALQNDTDNEIQRAFELAAQNGRGEVVRAFLTLAPTLKNCEDAVKMRTDDAWTALNLAASNGHEKVVQVLVDWSRNNHPDTARQDIMSALPLTRQYDVMKTLLDNRDLMPHDTEGEETPLHRAARNGQSDIVQLLLKIGEHPTVRDPEGRTPLHLAAENGHEEVVDWLCAAKAAVNEKDENGWTPLHMAAWEGHEEVVDRLCAAEAAVNEKDVDDWTPLHMAAWREHEEVVWKLLIYGADMTAMDNSSQTPLDRATGADEIVEIMLRYNSPLQMASRKGDIKIVRLLLVGGADVNKVDGFYGTALQAAAHEGEEDIFRLLLEQHADVNQVGGFYGTALQAAAYEGEEDIFRLLLVGGADVNKVGGFYGTALQAAAHEGVEGLIRLMLERGTNVDKVGGFYGTALQAAAHEGAHGVIRLLLERHAKVNQVGGFYGTALHAAASGGYEEIVLTLVIRGAKINADEGWFGSALEAAEAHEHGKVVEILKGLRAQKRKKLPTPQVEKGDSTHWQPEYILGSRTGLPFPCQLNGHDSSDLIELTPDGLEVTYTGEDDSAASIRADQPIPSSCEIYYFEVTIVSRGVKGYRLFQSFLKIDILGLVSVTRSYP
jgi:ankyrin repeat protein